MLQVPATAGLFQSFTDVEMQYLISYVERDQYGHLRACWLCQVAKALLTGAHTTAAAGGGGGLRCQELRDMLSGLPQVRLWQIHHQHMHTCHIAADAQMPGRPLYDGVPGPA